jgi:hypothetical protein
LSPLLASGLVAEEAPNKIPEKAKTILENATQFELYSLEPKEAQGKMDALHGWQVLGKTPIKEAEKRKEILTSLEKNFDKPGELGARCFVPRHAIRATHEGKNVDLVICFECLWVYVYLDGKEERAARIALNQQSVAQPLLDKVLRDAGVPLAKKSKE